MRDLVVGTTVALSDGTLARSGGKVIKNVAGYDLGKLFTGSFGTLGLIVRVAVRLHPLPPAHRERGRRAATTRSGSAPRRVALAAPAARGRLPRRRLARRRRAAAACASAAPPRATRPRRRSRGCARSASSDCAVVEDDDELWMAQRVHQRGDCVLKVSGRVTDLPGGLPHRRRASSAAPRSGSTGSRCRRRGRGRGRARGARAARVHAARRARGAARATPGRRPSRARWR